MNNNKKLTMGGRVSDNISQAADQRDRKQKKQTEKVLKICNKRNSQKDQNIQMYSGLFLKY